MVSGTAPDVSANGEINTRLDVAGVFNVPTPLPVFQSWWKDESSFHRPIALTLRVSVNIDIKGMGGIRH